MYFWPILKREVHSYLVLPVVYIVICIFSVLSGYFFFTNLSLYHWINVTGSMPMTEGLWQFYFNDIRFVLILVMPLLTMRVFSEEKKTGTIELLCSYPTRDIDILVGKFLSCMMVFFLMLVLTALNILALDAIWNLSGTYLSIMSAYLGLFLLGCSLVSCGIFISSLTESQIVAGVGTIGVFVFFWFLTWNEMMAGGETIDMLKRFSLFDRVMNFFKGVIDTRDIAFFVLFSSFFFILTLLSLRSRTWRG